MRKFILITFILVSVAISEKILVDAATKFPELPCAYDDAIQRIAERNLIYRNANPPNELNHDLVHRKIEESQLFLEAAHACYARLRDAETKENRG